MKIEDMRNKVKIILEYPKKLIGFGIIGEKDLEKLSLKIFLKDGTEITSTRIKEISFALKNVKKENENNNPVSTAQKQGSSGEDPKQEEENLKHAKELRKMIITAKENEKLSDSYERHNLRVKKKAKEMLEKMQKDNSEKYQLPRNLEAIKLCCEILK